MRLRRIETPGIAHYAYLIADGSEALLVDSPGHRGLPAGGALADGDSFDVGDITVRALATPGHTPESLCYAVYATSEARDPWCVLTGDTLFFGTTGRTDLAGDDAVANAALLYDSVHEKLAGLADTALVLPAHGAGSVCGSGMLELPCSTIGAEKRHNEVFTLDRGAFARKKGGERMPRPPYFSHMEEGGAHRRDLQRRSPGRTRRQHVEAGGVLGRAESARGHARLDAARLAARARPTTEAQPLMNNPG